MANVKTKAEEYSEIAADPKSAGKRADAFARLVKAQAELVAEIVMRMPADSPAITELNAATANLRQTLGM